MRRATGPRRADGRRRPACYAAKVVVIGAGVSGMNAAAIALGMQAEVLLLDRNIDRLRAGRPALPGPRADGRLEHATRSSGPCSTPTWSSARCWSPARRRRRWSPTSWCRRMKPGSVLVDISIDQGGCFEDSRPTTHADPTYLVHNSVFYCVANMPGAVPHTSTYALTNVDAAVRRRAGRQGLAAGAAATTTRWPSASTPTPASSPTRRSRSAHELPYREPRRGARLSNTAAGAGGPHLPRPSVGRAGLARQHAGVVPP